MTRNQRYAERIRALVETRYGQDVCLLVAYGSFVNGTEHALSDVDAYFVPASDRAMELCRTFLIEGVGYDLFPMSWERLGSIADMEEALTPLVGEARVLYCRSDADARRFAALQEQLRAHLDDSAFLLRTAGNRVDQAQAALGRLAMQTDLGRARLHAGETMLLLSDACAYANGRTFPRGLKTQAEDLAAMPALPDGFLQDYHGVAEARDAHTLLALCSHALRETHAFLRRLQNAPAPAVNGALLADMLRESISTFNKLRGCAQSGNAPLAFISAVCLQSALDEMVQEAGAPCCDLLGAFDARDLPAFDAHAQGVLARLTGAAQRAGGDLQPYASMEDFLRDDPFAQTPAP